MQDTWLATQLAKPKPPVIKQTPQQSRRMFHCEPRDMAVSSKSYAQSPGEKKPMRACGRSCSLFCFAGAMRKADYAYACRGKMTTGRRYLFLSGDGLGGELARTDAHLMMTMRLLPKMALFKQGTQCENYVEAVEL